MAMDLKLLQNVGIAIVVTVVFSILWRKFWTPRLPPGAILPPFYRGWLPWIGCALEFSRGPMMFIEKKRKEMGPVYTLLIAGQRITFLADPKDFHHVFSSPNVDFDKAVDVTVMRSADMCSETFHVFNDTLQKRVVSRIGGKAASNFLPGLIEGFAEKMDQIEPGDCDLMDLVRPTMYRSVLDVIYGRHKLPTKDLEKYKEMEDHFTIYDHFFEIGTALPSVFLRQWSKSRSWLREVFRGVMESDRNDRQNGKKPNTLNHHLLDGMDSKDIHSFSLVIMWAALANTTPALYWTLAYLLKDERALEKARSQVAATFSNNEEVTEERVDSLTYIKHCIWEALRITAPGVVFRRVVNPITIKGMTVPYWDLLALSPFWAHRNPEVFPEPEKFVPERWETTSAEKNSLMESYIPFGAGRWQCPGKRLAMLEIQAFIALFLQRFDCKMKGPVPKMGLKRLAGVVHPDFPCPVSLKKL